jgi:hypothetical protein
MIDGEDRNDVYDGTKDHVVQRESKQLVPHGWNGLRITGIDEYDEYDQRGKNLRNDIPLHDWIFLQVAR